MKRCSICDLLLNSPVREEKKVRERREAMNRLTVEAGWRYLGVQYTIPSTFVSV